MTKIEKRVFHIKHQGSFPRKMVTFKFNPRFSQILSNVLAKNKVGRW